MYAYQKNISLKNSLYSFFFVNLIDFKRAIDLFFLNIILNNLCDKLEKNSHNLK